MKKFKDLVFMGTMLHLYATVFSTETPEAAKRSGHPDTLTSSTDDLIAIESVVQPQVAVPAFQSKWEKENISVQKTLYERIKKPRKAQSLIFDSRHEVQITNHDNHYEKSPHNISNDISAHNDISKYPSNQNIDSRELEDKAYHSDFVTTDQYPPNSASQNEPIQLDVNSHEDYSNSDAYGSFPNENHEISGKKNCTHKQYGPNDYVDLGNVAKSGYQTNSLRNPTINNNQMPSTEDRNNIITRSNFERAMPRHGYEKLELIKQPRSNLHVLKDAEGNMHYHVHNHQHNHNHHHLHGHKYNHLAGHIRPHQHHPLHNDRYRIIGKQQQPIYGYSYTKTHNNYDPQPHSLKEFEDLKPNIIDLNKFRNNPDRSREQNQNYRPIGSNDESYVPSHNKIKSYENNDQHSEHDNTEKENYNHNGYQGFNHDTSAPDKPNTENTDPEHSKYGPGHTETVSYTSESGEPTSAEEYKSNMDSREQPREYDSKSSSKDIASNDEYSVKYPHHNYKHNSAENEENHSSDPYNPQDGRYSAHHNYNPRSSPNAQTLPNKGYDHNIQSPVDNHETFHQSPPINEQTFLNKGYDHNIQRPVNNHENFHQSPPINEQTFPNKGYDHNIRLVNNHETFHQSPPINQQTFPISGYKYKLRVTPYVHNFLGQQGLINQGFSLPTTPIPREPLNGKVYIRHGNNFANEPQKLINGRHQKYIVHEQKLSDIQNSLVLPHNARIIEHHIGLPPILFRQFETPVVLAHKVRYAVHKIFPNPLKIDAFHQNPYPQVRNLQAVQTQKHLTLFPKWL